MSYVGSFQWAMDHEMAQCDECGRWVPNGYECCLGSDGHTVECNHCGFLKLVNREEHYSDPVGTVTFCPVCKSNSVFYTEGFC